MSNKYSTGIYQIRNVLNNKRYIGSAALSFKKRWRDHRRLLTTGKHHSRYLQRAWNKYGADAFVFEILLVCCPADCITYEQAFIDIFQCADGTNGYNVTPTAGSNRGLKMSAESCAKIAASKKGTVASAETRAKMSKARTGHKHTPESIAKMSAVQRGRIVSDATRKKVSVALTGIKRKPVSPETRAKLAACKLGKTFGPLTPKHRDNISAALRGKTRPQLTPEHRAKLAEAHRGKALSLKHRQQLSLAKIGNANARRKPARGQKDLF